MAGVGHELEITTDVINWFQFRFLPGPKLLLDSSRCIYDRLTAEETVPNERETSKNFNYSFLCWMFRLALGDGRQREATAASVPK